MVGARATANWEKLTMLKMRGSPFLSVLWAPVSRGATVLPICSRFDSSALRNKEKKKTRGFHSTALFLNIVKSRFADVPLSQKDVFNFVWENVPKYGARTALVRSKTDLDPMIQR